jgi:hypothetical protein
MNRESQCNGGRFAPPLSTSSRPATTGRAAPTLSPELYDERAWASTVAGTPISDDSLRRVAHKCTTKIEAISPICQAPSFAGGGHLRTNDPAGWSHVAIATPRISRQRERNPIKTAKQVTRAMLALTPGLGVTPELVWDCRSLSRDRNYRSPSTMPAEKSASTHQHLYVHASA